MYVRKRSIKVTGAGCDHGVHVDCCIVPKTASSRKRKGMAKNAGVMEKQKVEDESQRRLEQEFQKSVNEMQRKMTGQTIAYKPVLQALDDACDYIGPPIKGNYYWLTTSCVGYASFLHNFLNYRELEMI